MNSFAENDFRSIEAGFEPEKALVMIDEVHYNDCQPFALVAKNSRMRYKPSQDNVFK
ncbi:MAG: hypothetical protein WC602_05355 [archaeon]